MRTQIVSVRREIRTTRSKLNSARIHRIFSSSFREKKKKERKKQKSEKNPIRDFDLYVFFFSFFSVRLFHVTITGAIDRGMIFCATFSVYRGFPIGRDRSRKIIIFPKREIRPGNCRLRKQEKSRNVRVKFCSWIELKERKQGDGDRDKINEKKKGERWKKFFPPVST